MFGRTVLRQSGVFALNGTAGVCGHTMALVKNLDRRSGNANLDFFVPELEWNTVVVAFDLDVIVDVWTGFLPLGKDERLRW
jgi:hypothetical protein